ncbi:MAG: NAD(P)H-binding protein [Desulfohalobiaceae bacterium]|nr:NAD(P)H-binding protein [Desulfohalobiaceae bacterium]
MSGYEKTVLLTGATGFIGGRLLLRLNDQGIRVRCLVRSAKKFQAMFPDLNGIEMVEGDPAKGTGLSEAMQDIEVAYYLIHSMGSARQKGTDFIEQDRKAAENFRIAGEKAGVDRVIYLSGLGEHQQELSEHLSSRQEVGKILASGQIKATELRAGVIIGSGGAGFEIIRYLVERLPVMIAPMWVNTRCQPIAVDNVMDYLLGCLTTPETAGRILEICGPEVLSYRKLILCYANVRRLKRAILSVPVLTPKLSAYWVQLITPVPNGIVRPLIEGLKSEVVCRDNRIRDMIQVDLIPMKEAICIALTEVEKGPGGVPSRQSCFLHSLI